MKIDSFTLRQTQVAPMPSGDRHMGFPRALGSRAHTVLCEPPRELGMHPAPGLTAAERQAEPDPQIPATPPQRLPASSPFSDQAARSLESSVCRREPPSPKKPHPTPPRGEVPGGSQATGDAGMHEDFINPPQTFDVPLPCARPSGWEMGWQRDPRVRRQKAWALPFLTPIMLNFKCEHHSLTKSVSAVFTGVVRSHPLLYVRDVRTGIQQTRRRSAVHTAAPTGSHVEQIQSSTHLTGLLGG